MKQLTILSLTFLLLTGFAQAQKLDLKKDQKITVVSKSSVKMNQEVMGQTMDINSENEDEKLLTVKEAGADKYTITGKMTKAKSQASAMGKDVNFDSENPDAGDPEMAEQFKKTMEMPIEFTVDAKTGNVTMAEMAEDADPTGGMMSAMGGDPAMEYDMLFLPLEKSKLKAGTNWSDSVENEGIKTVNTYTVKEVKGNEAVITRKSVMTIGKTVEAQQGMEVEVNMTITSEGDGNYDTKTGLLKSAKVISTGGGSADAMGMNIPITVNVEKTITVK